MKLIRNFGLIAAVANMAARASEKEPVDIFARAANALKTRMAIAPDADAIVMGPAEDAIARLRTQLAEAQQGAEAITQKADDEERDLTPEELTEIGDFLQTVESAKKQIEAREKLVQSSAGPGRQTKPTGGDRTVPATMKDTQKFGFKSFGEFAMATRGAVRSPADTDKRLLQIATTFGNEGTGADGGFLVPPEFRNEIWQKINSIENLFSRTTQLVTGSNNLTIPKDETTPWDTTKGVQVYWESEGGQIAQTKPSFDQTTLKLNKLTGLVPVSEELLEDAPGLESWLRAKVPMKMTHKLNRAIIRGTGVGQPLGIMNAGSLISVAKETSQAADTVLHRNIVNMWARMPVQLRASAVWLINQDVETQLHLMSFRDNTETPIPVYLPPGGVSATPYGTILGRPALPMESCSALGDKGDIILVALDQYFGLSKGQQVQTDVSMHFLFDQALMAFRFILRIGGQPIWGDVIQPEFGTTTRSWAVVLDDRA